MNPAMMLLDSQQIGETVSRGVKVDGQGFQSRNFMKNNSILDSKMTRGGYSQAPVISTGSTSGGGFPATAGTFSGG